MTPAAIATVAPPIRIEPVQQRGAQRVQLLLDVAAKLIDEKGIDALTTTEVAARSGSSVGVVYRYFPNIQSLLRALAARNMERYTERVFTGLAEEPSRWLDSLDHNIDSYVHLMRTEPGFRTLRFGDIIDDRFLETSTSNNDVLAHAFAELMTRKYGLTASGELLYDLQVLVEIADALLKRAFLNDRNGDERFIETLRVLAREHMAKHEKL